MIQEGLKMRIAIIGAGAIGGLLAARLTAAGEDVCVVARGVQKDAIGRIGLKVIGLPDGELHVRPRVVSSIGEAGPQDLIVLGVKAHQVAAIAPDINAALGPQTMILTAQNGIPWWYFMKHGGAHEGRTLDSVDPSLSISAHLPVDRVLASVVYPAAELVAPGVIQFIEGERFTLSEIDQQKSERIASVSQVFTNAGFKAPVSSDVRAEIWTKLWGNLSFNPISALTGATLAGICRDNVARALAADMMREAQAVGEGLGIRFRIPLEKRIAGAQAVGEHKTSMLQDIEAGRPTEIEALVGSVIELGQITGVPTPHISAIYACVKLLEARLRQS
jgi:2-dehydropantoate 2-reductase